MKFVNYSAKLVSMMLEMKLCMMLKLADHTKLESSLPTTIGNVNLTLLKTNSTLELAVQRIWSLVNPPKVRNTAVVNHLTVWLSMPISHLVFVSSSATLT